ncbi:hypothetical protein AKJ16_DCAP14330 [Drosera capensis]
MIVVVVICGMNLVLEHTGQCNGTSNFSFEQGGDGEYGSDEDNELTTSSAAPFSARLKPRTIVTTWIHD